MNQDPRYHGFDGDPGLRGGEDARLHAPATQRNRQPILDVLLRVLPSSGTALELASGTGEHAVWFAHNLRPLVWQPSDPDPQMRRSIDSHARAAEVGNIRPAIEIDVTRGPWPVDTVDAIVCINLLHISPWQATEGLFAGAAAHLAAGAPLVIYGPFKRGGVHSAESNERFDVSLKASNPEWGVRDLDAVAEVAAANGFALEETIEMPANNLTVVFRRNDG